MSLNCYRDTVFCSRSGCGSPTPGHTVWHRPSAQSAACHHDVLLALLELVVALTALDRDDIAVVVDRGLTYSRRSRS
eukprot:7942905-Heterocapsa_arctica.AAC.1